MKYYVRLMLNLAFIGFAYGFVAPYLISANDSSLVLAGIVVMFGVVPAGLYYGNRDFIKTLWEKFNNANRCWL